MASQIIDEIRNQIETQLATSTSVVLDESIIGVSNIGELFGAVFAASSLTLTDASVTVDGDSFSINGTSIIFGSIPKPVVITFLDSGGLNLRLAGSIENQIRLSDIEGQLFKDFTFLPTRLATLQFDSFTVEIIPSTETVQFTVKDQSSLDFGAGFLTLEEPTLMLSGSQVTQGQPSVTLVLQGILVIAGKRFLGRGLFGTDVTGQAPFTITPITDTLTLSNLIQNFLNISIPQLPDLAISDLQLLTDIDSNNFNFGATLEDWDLSLGVSSLRLNSLTTEFRKDAEGLFGNIQGNTNIAGTEATIRGNLQENLVLSGNIGRIDLSDLLRNIRGSVTIPGDFPTIQLPGGSFQIQLDTDNPVFVIGSSLSDFGLLIAVIEKISGEWQYAVAFSLPADWKFSRLLSLLKPLDDLKITPPKLLLSSFDDDEFQFPSLPDFGTPPGLGRGLQEGIVLSSSLALDGFGLNFIAVLIGRNELPIRLVIGDSIAESEVISDLGITIVVVPGVITFDEFSLVIDPSPFSIAFSCTAKVIIFNEELPRFSTAVVLEETRQKIVFETEEAWITPFGISGFTINQVILDIETLPQRKFGVLGDVSISDKRIRVAAQFTEGSPSGLVGELIGKLSLSEIVRDLVGLTLPPIIDISVSDFKIYIVADPLGMTIGSEFFEPGLALQGLFETFGLGMFVKIKISADNGVFARGALKDKIQLGNVFVVSNAAGDGPPEMQLDTANSPFLTITGKVFLLGLSKSIEASLDDSGFSLRIEENLGIARYELDCQVNSLSNFRANGSFSFGLKADIGPIQVTSGGPSLGKIKLDTGFDGSLDLSLIDRVFSARIDGSFSFVGTSFNLPTISLSASLESIEEIPELVKQRIIDNARDIFEDLLNDAGKWLEAVGDELIELAENATEKAKQVARVLRDQFNESAEEVGTAIRNTLDLGSKAAAEGLESIGESAEKIASVLKDLGDGIDDVSSVLKDLGKGADEIGDALRAAGFSDTDIDNVLRILFPIPPVHLDIHTDTPIIPAVSFHGDTPLIPAVSLHGDVGHADEHGDVGHADEHGDVGHADVHGDVGHADVHGDVGHGDAHGDVHGDVHGDKFGVKFHTDTRTGPHTDIPAVGTHTDIPAVGTHTDVAAVGFHTDVAAVGFHTDVAEVGFHTDTPEVGHVDLHTDTPEVGHGDAHGDVS
jgi:ElaB/YqjD/DUF883 family membrane-anchored ribosome-binding protein